MNSLEQAEDLKAFERRLTEYIHCLQPATGRWRMLLIVVSVCTATGAWNWLIDPETQKSFHVCLEFNIGNPKRSPTGHCAEASLYQMQYRIS
ncbi:hypothetical protein A6R68_04211 [Neotoma lepida]|uniref:Nuclear envelope phosphatase-regulatory subunit 1 n=1 Tax=Neotoma lepida TaxID=56216 RepID=A0A1A6GN23_NEOLE|nr:hypothetical protein A6R68_04211 [Neotoma lepida]